ncbi:MAG: YdeI/OmpD-associated family protein [Pseudomonadota bacterium]
MPKVPERPDVEIKCRADLRAWLKDNHTTSASVWLVTWKKHTAHYVPFGDLIEELLCWGWVDSRTRGVDVDRSSVLIAPRNPASAWSAVNKSKVAAARASGAMTEAGEALIRAAQANDMWTFLDDVERLEVPPDLGSALEQAEARKVWDDYPRSVKRGALEWIKTAKTSPTRAKRIGDVASSAEQGLRPSPFRR